MRFNPIFVILGFICTTYAIPIEANVAPSPVSLARRSPAKLSIIIGFNNADTTPPKAPEPHVQKNPDNPHILIQDHNDVKNRVMILMKAALHSAKGQLDGAPYNEITSSNELEFVWANLPLLDPPHNPSMYTIQQVLFTWHATLKLPGSTAHSDNGEGGVLRSAPGTEGNGVIVSKNFKQRYSLKKPPSTTPEQRERRLRHALDGMDPPARARMERMGRMREARKKWQEKQVRNSQSARQ
ncbi:hypothetical protein BDP27DRAFT_1320725 [Rhodocollybia butyracea]|uniref:Uncharacterized protein n=1 Tax=Rhodocollybia butyracea TaxID=206335 RepID=A0A9P5UAS4_9AGAR|nr:hypothetical protein BDP27DRAFT_1320725 [Rhodocollybia butyracea]